MFSLIGKDDGKRAIYARVRKHGHPLCTNRGKVRVCRLVLYEKIGPGEHSCNWCGKTLRWYTGTRGNPPDSIVADHVDGDPTNDSSENIVPSCVACNGMRGRPDRIHDGETVYWEKSNGCRTRHRGAWIECQNCRNPFISPVTQKLVPKRKFCTQSCAASANKNFHRKKNDS